MRLSFNINLLPTSFTSSILHELMAHEVTNKKSKLYDEMLFMSHCKKCKKAQK